jgi:hypothetical protein
VLLRNTQINPMSVKVPTGTKLAGTELDRFKAQVARVDTAMKSARLDQFAAVEGRQATGRAR